ncbi:MAG: hypothetical protein E6469_12860 [Clostridium perfringens]|uniref:hypothetical protein n=1 Tax=Clostridium perfringens TaxID=1502 RepID=UPI001241B540|nr:hypothetical protein [Clostridium perfringens]MDB2047309.1 hypothetical protein [Clostridium perfringens]MDK0812069.1 hypothetical protein [Clostridium perfringens]MDU6691692.1 hypothetical protein [Clostridium perfringens]UBK94674.1 hypothetical protein KLF37_15370 [Clostridium perfringens]
MEIKKAKEILIASILNIVYLIVLIIFILKPPIDMLIVNFFIPHIILVIFALIFNLIGCFKNKYNFVLIAIIFYLLAGLFPMFILIVFLIPSMLLSFIGYINLKTNKY